MILDTVLFFTSAGYISPTSYPRLATDGEKGPYLLLYASSERACGCLLFMIHCAHVSCIVCVVGFMKPADTYQSSYSQFCSKWEQRSLPTASLSTGIWGSKAPTLPATNSSINTLEPGETPTSLTPAPRGLQLYVCDLGSEGTVSLHDIPSYQL